MPEMTSYAPGMFCWVELTTSDGPAARSFYTSLFGWTTNEIPVGPNDVYVMLEMNGKTVGALFQKKDMHSNWGSYVAVTSADEAAEKAKSLGANIIAPPFDVMDVGRMAVIADPQGAVFSVWEARRSIGAAIVGETGTLVWNELMTTDADSARNFYPALFGWTAKVSPEYTEWHLGGRGIGGMIEKLPPGAPPNWIPYFAVDDTDATVQKTESLGGRVYMPGTDIPNVGRFAVLADPQGASFAIIQVQMRA
jgi:predicted enzyme related to lactoylglutathione lyase